MSLMSLDALIDMSNRYGSVDEFVLGGGGNTSYKEDNTMYVKGSGASLAEVTADEFVIMNLQRLLDALEYKYPGGLSFEETEAQSFKAIMAARMPGQEPKRPSVESCMHALFPYKYVLHLHPVIVNGLTCSKDFKYFCEKLFPNAVCVTVAPPGPGLARLCKAAVNGVLYGTQQTAQQAFPQVVFLQNHGILVAADTVGEIDDLMTTVIDTLTREVKEFPDLTNPSFYDDGISRYNLRDNPLTPEQALFPDDEVLLNNAVKIAVYAESFGGISPLPPDIANIMREYNPYG